MTTGDRIVSIYISFCFQHFSKSRHYCREATHVRRWSDNTKPVGAYHILSFDCATVSQSPVWTEYSEKNLLTETAAAANDLVPPTTWVEQQKEKWRKDIFTPGAKSLGCLHLHPPYYYCFVLFEIEFSEKREGSLLPLFFFFFFFYWRMTRTSWGQVSGEP